MNSTEDAIGLFLSPHLSELESPHYKAADKTEYCTNGNQSNVSEQVKEVGIHIFNVS